ncbi:hypothetical protein J4E83_002624 [Alternaria metachromatica]|uniref:uncharacterized protein n=1 Tax=Alternaria metachromatica TaxID=283354 RepID=UPI0020C397B0|nr:uncharacterized protein J4E83_002624 [Alternaria metachromatica]KAI4631096.1 hypothetical protein J4E83_002624 [Alternaria metachromatica]
MTSIKEIYAAAQNLHQNELQTRHTFVWFDPDTSTESLLFASDAKDQKSRHALEEIIEKHCVDHLLTAEVSCDNTEQILRDILEVWENTGEGVDDVDRRMLAILVSRDIENPSGHNEKQEARWGTAIIDHLIQTMDPATWLSFMQSLETIFADIIADNTNKHELPSLLQPQILTWVSQVLKFGPTLTKLEEVSDSSFAVRQMLSYVTEPQRKRNLAMLSLLQKAEGNSAERIMQNILIWVCGRISDMREVIEYLSKLLDAPYEAIEACNEIWDAKCGFLDIPGLPTHEQADLSRIVSRDVVYCDGASKQYKVMTQPDSLTPKKKKPLQTISKRRYDIPLAVAEVMVAGWIQDDDVALETKTVIERLAQLLDLKVYKQNIPKSELSKATEFWDGIEAEIMREAERLEGLKRTLKAKDPLQTALLIEEYNIPDSNLLEDEIQELPPGIIDLVELIDDDEIEMSFTLASYTELQRSAMGVPSTANNLLIRLTIDRYALPLDVRIPEIRTDIFAVDMLLSSVYSAAMANKIELLPNCPIHPISTVKTILDSLPKLSVIRDAVQISTTASQESSPKV